MRGHMFKAAGLVQARRQNPRHLSYRSDRTCLQGGGVLDKADTCCSYIYVR